MKEKLKVFCHKTNPRIAEPWTSDGFVFATNGQVLIRITGPVEGVIPRFNPVDCMKVIQENPEPQEWFPVPDVTPPKEPKEKICDECDGNGETNCRTCGQVTDCPECGGIGKIIPAIVITPIEIGGIWFSNLCLHQIKTCFSDAEIGPNEYPNPARLRFSGGDGLLVPTKQYCPAQRERR